MKSAVWISRGPETTQLKRDLMRSGYRIVDSVRVRSEHTRPKTLDLLVRVSPR